LAAGRDAFRVFRNAAAIESRGIDIGSLDSHGSEAMTVFGPATESPSSALIARQRDRRRALVDLLAAVVRTLDRRDDVWLMRGALEQALRTLLPVTTVQLRDPSSLWSSRNETAPGAESIALEVPGSEPAGPGVLEASFEPGSAIGEWDFQLLGIAAHVGALVLEVERSHRLLGRAGLLIERPRAEAATPLIGSTPAMRALRDTIERVSATDFTVLLEGESGVGKELVARQIHEKSRRRNGPFIAVNCAAIVDTLLEAELFGIEDRVATGVRARKGKFEAAENGTLFLDEVSDLSPSAQAKLLRVLQDLAVERVGGHGVHRVDTRVIAATNRRLGDQLRQKAFRPDLFYRLSGVDIHVPSLRDRRDDIMELATYFLARHKSIRRLRFSPEATDALVTHDWPGNVRELERTIERAVALCEGDAIRPQDLTPAVGGTHAAVFDGPLERSETLRLWARRYVRFVLARHSGNKRAAADALGISYHTLQAYVRAPIDHDGAER
jgi:DNA-binding NtrC family response regulator